MDCKSNSYKDTIQKTSTKRSKTLRRVISSKSLLQNGYGNGKSCSMGIFGHVNKPPIHKPKKTTKSDQTFNKNMPKIYIKSDICKKCGDSLSKPNSKICNDKYEKTEHKHSNIHTIRRQESIASTSIHYSDEKSDSTPHQMATHSSNTIKNKNHKSVHQYYKNEEFVRTSESDYISESKNKIKPSLSTIREVIETPVSKSKSSRTIYQIFPESSTEEMGYFDYNKKDNIKEINEFRNRNYFECHSAKTRVNVKGSATSLGEHKCFYRFYLNERLFPVPMKTDHHKTIRCVECKLPLDETRISDSINGTIQAKVKLNNEVQDMILMLPVKAPLIVKERRKQLQSVVDPEVLYFGVIKLNPNGDSVFNRTLPSNSFALKYQKGYKEVKPYYSYKYDSTDGGDVIII